MSNLNTIFEQDGKVYCVMSHDMPVKDLALETGRGIRAMAKIPRARMRVVTTEEFKAMPFGSPECECHKNKPTREPAGARLL